MILKPILDGFGLAKGLKSLKLYGIIYTESLAVQAFAAVAAVSFAHLLY